MVVLWTVASREVCKAVPGASLAVDGGNLELSSVLLIDCILETALESSL